MESFTSKVVDMNTLRKYIWKVLSSLSTKSRSIIRWENRFKNDRGKTCKVSVDGTDFKIPRQKPHRRDKKYYSHKIKHAAYRYEVGVCIQTGEIVWINGPFPAGKWPDINIFRRNLKQMLLPGEMVEADRGYRDLSCRHSDVVVSKSDGRAKSRAMTRHETVNSDLKTFGCLEQQWRHELSKHSLAFSSCAMLTQLKYKLEGGPKFQVDDTSLDEEGVLHLLDGISQSRAQVQNLSMGFCAELSGLTVASPVTRCFIQVVNSLQPSLKELNLTGLYLKDTVAAAVVAPLGRCLQNFQLEENEVGITTARALVASALQRSVQMDLGEDVPQEAARLILGNFRNANLEVEEGAHGLEGLVAGLDHLNVGDAAGNEAQDPARRPNQRRRGARRRRGVQRWVPPAWRR